MSKISKLDQSWEKLFDKYKILDEINKNTVFEITAKDINEFREARLMTKFDHSSQLPSLFRNNKLSILPVTRGSYIIGRFNLFHTFEPESGIECSFEFPYLESLDYENITSESIAINCAYVSKILHDFVNEEELLPTVNGRMSSSKFSFEIQSPNNNLHNIQVTNSQIEIDGGYEGNESLILIEAKNYISDDFLIRQLYYPYRLWESKVSKKVRPVFLTYSNGEFHLREYAFNTLDNYNSIHLVRHKKYVVQRESFNIEKLQKLLINIKILPEPSDVPFPQADDFNRIINLCELLLEKDFLSKDEITENYAFTSRQTDYYSQAGQYLGLINLANDPVTKQTGCFLTELGHKILTTDLADRQELFIERILSHRVFNETLKSYLENGLVPSRTEIVLVMKESKLNGIEADSTFFRRASTVISWMHWILDQIEP